MIPLWAGCVPASVVYQGAFLACMHSSCRRQYSIYLRKQILQSVSLKLEALTVWEPTGFGLRISYFRYREIFFLCAQSPLAFSHIHIYVIIPVIRFLARGETANWFTCGNVGEYLLQCILTRNQNTKVRHVLLPLFSDSYLQNVLIVFYHLLCYYLLCVLWRFYTFTDVRWWCAVVKKIHTSVRQEQAGFLLLPQCGGGHLFSP